MRVVQMTRDPKQDKGKGKGRKGRSLRRSFALAERYQRFLLLLLLSITLTVIIVPKGAFIPDHYFPGDVASRDIKAPKDILIPDLDLTEKKRIEAEDAVLPFYDFDARAGQEISERLIQAIRLLHRETARGAAPDTLHKEVETALGLNLSDADLKALAALPSDPQWLLSLRTTLQTAFEHRVVGNRQLFQADKEKGIIVRNLETRAEEPGEGLEDVLGPSAGLERVIAQLRTIEEITPQGRQVLQGVVQNLFRPNLTFNKEETENRKKQARELVKPVLFQVKKGEMIVRVGERVTEEQIVKLRALRDSGTEYDMARLGLGLMVCALVLIYSTHRFAQTSVRKYRPQNKDLLFLGTVFIGLFALTKLLMFISGALESAFPYIDSASYYYLFPFAVGAMLVRIVLNSETALVFVVLSSLLFGIMFGDSLFIAFYALVGSFVGAHWVRHCKERTSLYQAGMRLSLVNAIIVIAIHLISGRAFDAQLLYQVGFGLAGGFLCALIVTGTIPLVEYIFKYTTDIKLLELANLNTPVLRELMIQAPGTYHHSIIVGNLVEAGAEAIHANPLLARVAAYYHDIGKIRKPLYFIENLGMQENRHDKLAPSMSALILMAHVKDGAELARESGLGEPLVNIIRQHHGTSLIKFFYDKAKGKEGAGMPQIDERDYRYPGPKPQTREAALIMLADAVEAASRTLTDPTPARIQGMVQKIINNIFIDGQLDECELTLKDLHNIAKSFNKILGGIFHHRIDYPEPAYKERDREPVRRNNVEDLYREPPKEAKNPETAPEKSGSEDLRRLGMS